MYEDILTKDFLIREYSVNKKTKANIARETGVCTLTVSRRLKKFNIPDNHAFDYKSKDLTDQVFGRLTVLKRAEIDKHKKSRWLCQCNCGRQKVVNASSLLRGLTFSCNCLKEEKVRKGYKDISFNWWKRKNNEARTRDLEFNITIEYVWELYEKQNRKCSLTDLDIVFYQDSNQCCYQTASIDRIDSNKGYIEGNVQIIHKTVNLMKNFLRDDEFIAFCNLIAMNHKLDYEKCVELTKRTVNRKEVYI